MSDDTNPASAWRPATKMVRGGTMRSNFEETSEAIFTTSGFVYGSAEQAEQAFKGEVDRFIYSRYANPTVVMFEKRLALMEGAAYGMAFASGMAALFGSLGFVDQIRRRNRAGRRHGPCAMGTGFVQAGDRRVPGNAVEPLPRHHRRARRRRLDA